MVAERGVAADRATACSWAMKKRPVLALICRQRKRSFGTNGQINETYIKIVGDTVEHLLGV